MIPALEAGAPREIYNGIKKYASKLGYDTSVCQVLVGAESSDIDTSAEYYIYDAVDYSHFDAIIVALNTINYGWVREKVKKILSTLNIPIIALDCDIEGAYKLSTANYSSQREIIEHIVDVHGCTKVNYISGPRGNTESDMRLQAYIDVMKERGIYDERRIYTGTFFVDSGERALEYYDSNDCTKDYEAIVCANDLEALSVYRAMIKRGRKASDVLVTGFDDIDEVLSFRPLLTTVSREGYTIGSKAVEILEQHFAGKVPPKETLIQQKMVVRESCGCKFDHHCLDDRYNDKLDEFYEVLMDNMVQRQCVQKCMKAENFQEFVSSIGEFIKHKNPEMFCLCMFDSVLKAMGEDEYPIFGSSSFDLKRTMYDARVVFSYERDGLQEGTERASRHYVETPLYFKEKFFGFIVLANSNYPLRGEEYWEFIEGIRNAFNSLEERLRLNDLYMQDSLTGLYNRFGLENYWKQFIEEGNENAITVCLMDMDGLKNINDVYGHDDGDFALKTLADVLRANASDDVIPVRFGGDEFVILARNVDAAGLCEKILADIALANKAAGMEYDISASIGYAINPSGNKMLEVVLNEADSLMYINKHSNR